MLIVTAGCGWTQCDGGSVEEIRAGGVIWCPPSHRHWHGATPATAMTHIAIQEGLDGKFITWMEKVPDEEYLCGPKRSARAPIGWAVPASFPQVTSNVAFRRTSSFDFANGRAKNRGRSCTDIAASGSDARRGQA